jgi:hypothetical protein
MEVTAATPVTAVVRLSTAGHQPDPFPDQTTSLLPCLLTATRAGLTPAIDDEFPIRS